MGLGVGDREKAERPPRLTGYVPMYCMDRRNARETLADRENSSGVKTKVMWEIRYGPSVSRVTRSDDSSSGRFVVPMMNQPMIHDVIIFYS